MQEPPSNPPTNQLMLRQMLADELQALREGKILPERANAISSLANTILKSINQQVYYAVQRGEKPYTAFIKPEIDS